MLQGTFLPAAVAAELSEMQLHPRLLAAADQLESLHARVAAAAGAAHAAVWLPRQVELRAE